MAFLSNKTSFCQSGTLANIKHGDLCNNSWHLKTSITNSLDPSLLNYDFQRTEEGCSNVNSLVMLDGGRPLFVFMPNLKYYQDFNETILETIRMLEKSLKMLVNISSNVNPTARLV